MIMPTKLKNRLDGKMAAGIISVSVKMINKQLAGKWVA